MRAIDAVAQLPDGLEPGDKGAWLLEYVRHGTPVDGLDFSMVLVPRGTDLSDANLKGGRFRHGVFEEVRLDGADLRGAELRHSRAAGASLDRALLHEADLRHVDLEGGTAAHLHAFADALDILIKAGRERFRARLACLGDPSVGLVMVERRVPAGATNVGIHQARALVAGVAAAIRQLESEAFTDSSLNLAKALDVVEYVPCEFLRLGPTLISRLDDPAAPTHVAALVATFRKQLADGTRQS